MAKKSSSKKQSKTTKKSTTKKSASKKTASKKAPAKKAAPKKKAASKKTTTKKAASKKTAAKKTASKKAASKKAATKKASTKKTASKTAASKKKTTKKKVEASKADGAPGASGNLRTSASQSVADGRAAAMKLAAAAGLGPALNRSNGEQEQQEYERLTKSPFNKRALEKFKGVLLEKRAQLVGDVAAMESEALNPGGSGSLSHLPQHMADQGSDTYDQSLALDLAASQRDMLKEIDDALDRIDAGTYGVCEMLGKPISEERLDNAPWSRFSIEAARMIERTGYPT